MHFVFFSPSRLFFSAHRADCLTISLDLESILQKRRKRDNFLENKMWLFAMWRHWSRVSAAVMTPVVGNLVVSHRQHRAWERRVALTTAASSTLLLQANPESVTCLVWLLPVRASSELKTLNVLFCYLKRAKHLHCCGECPQISKSLSCWMSERKHLAEHHAHVHTQLTWLCGLSSWHDDRL